MPPSDTAEKVVDSVEDYLRALPPPRGGRQYWFRGQTNRRWPLTPSLARKRGKNWLGRESLLEKRFRQNALALLTPQTREPWDWQLLMQHYGVPTRLLDWTENPMAALYFAIVGRDGKVRGSIDGCVWCLNPVALNRASGDPSLAVSIPCLGIDALLNQYLPANVAKAGNSLGPVAVLAQRAFPRLVAQSGVFTLIHNDRTPLEKLDGGKYAFAIRVPGRSKKTLRSQLKTLGVTRLTLFPELESVAEIATDFAH